MAADAAPAASRHAVEASAVRMLAGREHSIEELRRKLCARGHDEALVDEVLRTLTERNLLSEARFVESFVHARVERGQGPLRIRAELRERGIEETAIDAALTRPSEFWLTQVERVRAKRFGDDSAKSRDEWTRQARFLAQRGFPSDLIYRTLDR